MTYSSFSLIVYKEVNISIQSIGLVHRIATLGFDPYIPTQLTGMLVFTPFPLLLVLLCCLPLRDVAGQSIPSGEGQSPPNIIYILVDDLGYGDVNLNLPSLDRFGNPNVYTPNLARLAREGLVFTHHYAASPVCSPSRAGLLTGRTPTRANIGLYINDTKDNDRVFLAGQELTVAEVLKEQGYATAIFGKWHLNGADWEVEENWTGWTGSFPRQQGFDYGIVAKENPHFTRKLRVNTQKHPGDFFDIDGRPLGPLRGYTSDIITEHALDWILSREKEEPFFAYLPYDAVHIRVSAADRYLDLYDTGNARQDAYYANITHVDAAIGILVRRLGEAGLLENTLIFFSSDNGPDVLNMWDATYFCYGTSYPLKGEKYQLYEGGIRVPGIVYWPGTIAAGVSAEPNSTLDVLPTLAELTGARLPEGHLLDGQSILPLLLDGAAIDRQQPLYWQFDLPREYLNVVGEGYQRRIVGPQRSREELLPRAKVRQGDHILYGLTDTPYGRPTDFRLYNAAEDFLEERELSASEPELFAELRDALLRRHTSVEQDRRKVAGWIEKNAPAAAGMQKLRISDNQRWLVTEDGQPFFWLGDTAWNLFSNLDSAEVRQYFADRRAKGFNVVQVQAIPWEMGRTNALGEAPFINDDLDRPNEAYWQYADYIVETAEAANIYLALLPLWARSFVETIRAKDEVKPFLRDSTGLPFRYGKFLGERYGEHNHLIWIMGGDEWGTKDTVYHQLARGIVEGSGRAGFDQVLMSYHPQGGTYRPPATSTSEFYPAKEWMDFNMIQSGHRIGNRNFERIAADYALRPVKPTIDSEPGYEAHPVLHKFENGTIDAWHVRRRGYWSVLAGAFGFTYGANGIWQMAKPGLDDEKKFNYYWYDALHLPGSLQMRHLRSLIESRPFVDNPSLVPDQSVIVDLPDSTDYHVQSARADDYSYRIVYFTNGAATTLDLTQPAEVTYRAWWYSPRDGMTYAADGRVTEEPFGRFPSGTRHTFDPPGVARPDNDWVLLLDDITKDYPPPHLAVTRPAGVTVEEDVRYSATDSTARTLIIAYPEPGPELRPAIVHFHGGGWRKGSASRATAVRFAAEGFVGVSINYRHSQEAIFPAAVHDGKSAVRWLRANAEKYGVDPGRIGLFGGSAGGHLALLTGLSAGDTELEGSGPHGEYSSEVAAIVSNYGPTDFSKMNDAPGDMDHDSPTSPESRFVGGPVQELSEAVQRANPINYVDAKDPPVLLVHGREDMSVPFNQSELLYAVLQREGIISELLPVAHAGHGFKPSLPEAVIAPSREELYARTVAWFRKHL